MKIIVKKTDKRHTASDKFKYYAIVKKEHYTEPTGLALEKFYEIRAWCWETWGPAREANEPRTAENSWQGDKNDHWSWINDPYRARIYFTGKDEAALFTLRWS